MPEHESNPFLIIPPPGTPKKAAEPAMKRPVDAENFITLPSGIVDSGPHRVAASRVAARARPVEDEIVFFAAPPGAPVPTVPGALEPDLETPRGSDPQPAPRFALVLPGGQRIPVDRAVFVGRNPVSVDVISARQAASAALLAVDDPAKSVSKTHALLEIDGDRMLVHDLDSTNGVWVSEPGRDVVEVRPGHPVVVPSGSDIELGQYVLGLRSR